MIVKRFGDMVVRVPSVYRKSELAAALAQIGPVRLAPRRQPRSWRRRASGSRCAIRP